MRKIKCRSILIKSFRKHFMRKDERKFFIFYDIRNFKIHPTVEIKG